MSDTGLFVGVLGPLTVVYAGERVAIGGPKERLVLAILLARPNAVVSVDALVEGVWSGSPPRSAERTVQAYVARLRRGLEPERPAGAPPTVLVTAGAGYRLQLATGQSDALLFEELARRGADQLRRADERAARTLRQALELWRGEPYGEFGELESCAAEARRLGELRVVALEDRLDADLAAGGRSELVAELESAVADHPFRERFWCQLMLAQYRAGRQRDALATFQHARSVLTDELGLEPGPELRELEAAILEQNPRLDRVVAASGGPHAALPLALDAVGPSFVGRGAELAWLRSVWSEAAAGHGRFVSVLGQEGIGKTRLVAALAQEVQSAGAIVLYGRCDHAHRGARALLDQSLRSGGSSLSEVDSGQTPLADLAGAVARFLPVWAQGRPVLLALDDLHVADADTLEVVADLASWSGAGPILVVAAFRTDAPSAAGATPVGGEAAQVALAGLDREALGELCTIYAPSGWTADDISWLHDLTGGVPLQVHEHASEWARQREGRRVVEAADRSTLARGRLTAATGEIADSVEAIQHLLEERRAHLAAREAELGAGTDSRAFELCPYKGLAPFEASDAANFFGRERLVAELVARLAGASLLTVIGPSGSGKSSLVRAGLLPALAAGVIPGAGGWSTAIVTPGARPAGALSRRLAVAGDVTGRRAIFVDQFEEVFTVCTDTSERTNFVDQVVALAGRADTVVVLAIRADHLGHCAALPELADVMAGNDVLVSPMRESELRRAIELPCRRAGLAIEPGLVDVIIADVAGRPGALPLLSTALAETWERRTDRTLTLAGYRAAGGVNGALARMAEDAYQALGEGGQTSARRTLLGLCDSGDDGALDLRRRLPLAEVAAAGDVDAHAAVDALVARRLLTIDGDSVEVAHEALLREWPRLRAWLDEDVHGRRLRRRVSADARAWRAGGEDLSELYRGTRLDAALEWLSAHDADLKATEHAFLDASRREAAREVDDARRHAAEKSRANRRLRALLGGVAILLVVALLSGLLFLRQRNRAEEATRATRARELASEAMLALEEDPELAVLLALEAVETTRSADGAPLPEAIGALQRAVQASRVELRGDDGVATVAVSPDGRRLVTDSLNPPDALIWDAVTGEKLETLIGPGGAVGDLALSPDGELIAVSYRTTEGGPALPAIVLWDAVSGREVSRLTGPDLDYFFPSFSSDGRLVAAVSVRSEALARATVWDVFSGEELRAFDITGAAGSVQFVDGDQTLLVVEPDAARVGFYSIDDGRELEALPTADLEPRIAEVDPAHTRFALATPFQAVQVWSLPDRRLLQTIPVGDVWKVDWSPGGQRLALSGANQAEIRIVDPDSGVDIMTLNGHESGTNDVAFTPDGDRLASVQGTGGLRVWDVSPDGSPELGGLTLGHADGLPAAMSVGPDGSEVLVVSRGGTIELLATESGQELTSLAGQLFQVPSFVPSVSRNWQWIASVDERTGRATVRALPSLAPVAELPSCTSPVGFSPDGSLVVLDGRGPCTAVLPGLAPRFEAGAEAELRSRVIEVDSGREILDFGERAVLRAAFNPAGPFPAGRYLAINIEDTLEVHDVATGEVLITVDRPDLGLLTPTFDPTGRWLALSTVDGTLWVFDLTAIVAGVSEDESLILKQVVHLTALRTPAINEHGIVATAGAGDGLVRFWDLVTGEQILELRTETKGLWPIAFGHDGSYLLYAEGDVIRRYPLDTDELIELARTRLTRGFTADECAQYLDADRCS